MRQELVVSFETGDDIDDFREFIKFHAKRLGCPEEMVISRLVAEWKKSGMTVEVLIPKKEMKKSKKRRNDEDNPIP